MTNDARFSLVFSDEDGEWVGLCDDYPFLSHLDPDKAKALQGIRDLVAWLEATWPRPSPP